MVGNALSGHRELNDEYQRLYTLTRGIEQECRKRNCSPEEVDVQYGRLCRELREVALKLSRTKASVAAQPSEAVS
jgi:hypothetical protein